MNLCYGKIGETWQKNKNEEKREKARRERIERGEKERARDGETS